MIGKLRGIVDEKDDESIILDVGGVGYHVFVSSRLLGGISVGDNANLHIEMNVREDHIHLYGFPNTMEREWFRLLVTVQRLGNKMALSILGSYSPPQLVNSILAKDTAAFSRISGIGAKLAERIVIELKDKVMKMPTGDFLSDSAVANTATTTNRKFTSKTIETNVSDDVISALVNLGYSRSDAYSASTKAMQNSVQNGNETPSISLLITLSLKELLQS